MVFNKWSSKNEGLITQGIHVLPTMPCSYKNLEQTQRGDAAPRTPRSPWALTPPGQPAGSLWTGGLAQARHEGFVSSLTVH